MDIPFIIVSIIGIGYTGARIARYLHILQLEDYSLKRLIHFITRRPFYWFLPPPLLVALISIVINWWSISAPPSAPSHPFQHQPVAQSIIMVIWLLITLWTIRGDYRATFTTARKKLILTARARRIGLVAWVISLIAGVLLVKATLFTSLSFSNYYIFTPLLQWSSAITIWTGSAVLGFIWVGFSLAILYPIERVIARKYIAEAQVRLHQVRPLVIGITGSYGKTTTKEILSALLSQRWNTLKPPGSYNTLMGITRWIRESLRPYHEVLVVEIGAYRRGSITRVCELIKPHHGIISTIGLQHLERFGSVEAIKEAKAELVRSLPPDGIAVLNADNPPSREVGLNLPCRVVWFCGEKTQSLQNNLPKLQPLYQVREVRPTVKGTSFQLIFPDGEALSGEVKLLGRSTALNIAASVAMADTLGVPRPLIMSALNDLQPIPHRLNVKNLPDGVLLLDDAYNSNPIGARDALEVLRSVDSGQRVLITPGMIELGPQEKEANYRFGVEAAQACDRVVLIGGKRVDPIEEGLIMGGFSQEKIERFKTLPEALNTILPQLKPGDVILLENDLPDQYAGL